MYTLFAFECNISGSMHLNFKEAVRAGGGLSLEFRADKVHTKTEVVKRTVGIDLNVEIPPQSEVTVEWYVTEVVKVSLKLLAYPCGASERATRVHLEEKSGTS